MSSFWNRPECDLVFYKHTQLHPTPFFCLFFFFRWSNSSISWASCLSVTLPHTHTHLNTETSRERERLSSASVSPHTEKLHLMYKIQRGHQSCYWALKQPEHVPPLSFSNWGVTVSGTSDWSMSFSLAMMCLTKQLAASSMLMFSCEGDTSVKQVRTNIMLQIKAPVSKASLDEERRRLSGCQQAWCEHKQKRTSCMTVFTQELRVFFFCFCWRQFQMANHS